MRKETKIDNNKKLINPPENSQRLKRELVKSKGALSFVYVPQKDPEVGLIRVA